MDTKAFKAQPGFTIWEMIIALSLLSIIAAVSYPIVGHISHTFSEKEAVTRARILNCTKESYRIRTGDKNKAYASADESKRFELLLPYMVQEATTLEAFTPKGFLIELGSDINSSVVVWNPQGKRIDY